MNELTGKRAAILVEQQYQEMEVWYPLYRLREAGCQVTLVGPEAGKSYPSKLGYPAATAGRAWSSAGSTWTGSGTGSRRTASGPTSSW